MSDVPHASDVGAFAPGTVGHTLGAMVGVWMERVEVFSLDGRLLPEDAHAGSPGPAPWENLVYVSFDGDRYLQTNVPVRGRPPVAKTFGGRLREGILVFDPLGPDAPEHIGVSGGPGVVVFGPRRLEAGCQRYHEPDWVRLLGPATRTRTTVLYRDGVAVRTLTGHGQRVQPVGDRRVPFDPRGVEGPAHGEPIATKAFRA